MRRFRIVSILAIFLLLAADYGYFFYGLSIWWLALILFVYLSLLVLGSIFISWNFYLTSFNKGKNSKEIALTFDDGPAAETQAILDILKKESVEATFFIIGKNAAAKPELVKRMFAEGHVVGNHSYNHGFNFDWQTSKKMQSELEHTNQLVHKITGKLPKLFRPPYGVTNPNLAKAISTTGMHSIGWSLRSFDTKAKDPQQLLNKLLKEVKGGDIILLHDSMAVTREILTQFITDARKKGFTFVRVDKMLALEAYA